MVLQPSNSTGTIYLMRGPEVLSQLLGTSAPPVLASAPQALQHGSGNTVLTLSGSNFLPGVAAFWNGSYRTTTLMDSTHITIDVPYNDQLSPGSATITCSNPGSAASVLIATECLCAPAAMCARNAHESEARLIWRYYIDPLR